MIGQIELTKREKEVLKKYTTPQSLSEKDEHTIRGFQSPGSFFSTWFDWDNMVEIAETTKKGRGILKKGYYEGISIG